MLFNSPVFIVGFLPISLIGFFLIARTGRRDFALAWLVAASLFFYGWWRIDFVPLLIVSIVFNYWIGARLAATRSKSLLIAGVAVNLLVLGYYKYTGFLVAAANDSFGLAWAVPVIALPLAISFYTFQQIAYLSDAYDGVAIERSFLSYALFITFFPHLIAGPITHHKEMMPQFSHGETFRLRLDNIALGLTVFGIGLFKKVVIADGIALYSTPMFEAAGSGYAPTLFEAWGGALAYAMQIYFDFSGYSDMAIGLGLLFGIALPLNFNSPYKAANIIDFWSRWHMTLTRFLTAYIYNPLVMALTRRRMQAGLPLLRRNRGTLGAFIELLAIPTIVTMFLSGLWHGAGYQFLIFGLLHGFYLTVAHGWRMAKARMGWQVESTHPIRRGFSVLLTFLCVVVALVFFRAASAESGWSVLAGMLGLNGVVAPFAFKVLPIFRQISELLGLSYGELEFFWVREVAWLALLFTIVWLLPNTEQWMRHYRTSIGPRFGPTFLEGRMTAGVPLTVWRPTAACGFFVGIVLFFALMKAFSRAPSEFLYFTF